MSKNHVWIVEMKIGANWYPLFNDVFESRKQVRERLKSRRTWRPAEIYRVRKYVAEAA